MSRLGSRVARVALAALFLVGIAAARDLALPTTTVACSCRPPDPADIAEVANFSPEMILFEGIVTDMGQGSDEMGHSFGDLTVTRVYKGTLPSNHVRVIGGGGGDCTMALRVGQRLFGVGMFDGTSVTPQLCSDFGDPATPEAQPFLAAAVAAFGPGVVPREVVVPIATTPPASSGLISRDLALPLTLGGVLVVVVGLFWGVAMYARRPRDMA